MCDQWTQSLLSGALLGGFFGCTRINSIQIQYRNTVQWIQYRKVIHIMQCLSGITDHKNAIQHCRVLLQRLTSQWRNIFNTLNGGLGSCYFCHFVIIKVKKSTKDHHLLLNRLSKLINYYLQTVQSIIAFSKQKLYSSDILI